MQEQSPTPELPSRNRLAELWDELTRFGLAELVLRLGTHVMLLAMILLVAWVMGEFYVRAQVMEWPAGAVPTAPLATLTPGVSSAESAEPAAVPEILLPVFELSTTINGIQRQVNAHTDAPVRSRLEVSEYVVQLGDTLFGIAERFSLRPETLLWANQYVLGDNPHSIRPGQKLAILPVDGVYHRWSAGEGLNGVARFYGVQPDVIVNWPGNQLDPATLGDYAHPNIAPGTWLVVPGGRREFVNWSLPPGGIPRENPGAGKILGPGACSGEVQGIIGSGAFIWPTDSHIVSGFEYAPSANHPGIDLTGREGDSVYASDHGVVVYAGWNRYGYGNVVVINHGNGWQTLYAHLSTYYVSCGQGLYQGAVLGLVGSTGNSTGPHLHFEMMYNGVKVNPHDYLP